MEAGWVSMCARGLNPREERCLLRVLYLLGRVQRPRSRVGSETLFCLILRVGRHHPTSLSAFPKSCCQLCCTQTWVLLELWGDQAWGLVLGLGQILHKQENM